ncbi:hypothetical protein BDF21DRAFT_378346 [Thamnidium elegans]|nr:hypothetical protein BDF21DRAFT_378346 [Thamnidium elegans]
MQRDVFKKTFTLSHERFVLEVDPSQRTIKGLAELTIQPLNNKLTNLRINCRQCKIEKAFVNDIAVEFDYVDAVSDLTLGSNTTIAHHQVYKSRYLNALRDADEGELNVKLPTDCIKKISEGEASQLINNTSTFTQPRAVESSDPEKPTLTTEPAEPVEPTYSSLVIRIEYTLDDPRNGVVFVQKDDEIAPYRSNHVYTVNQPLPGATRSWLPCIDNIADRCTWDMEFIVPRKDEGAIVPEYDGEGAFDEVDGMVVVCSGEVLEQVIHPTDATKKIVHYRLSEPTPAPFIGFAIGPFKMIKLSPSQLQEEVMTAADLDENQQQSLMAEINMMSNIYAFALPGSEEELSVSCSFLMHAMHFYTQEYGSYPFSDYKLVFVEDAWSDTASSASLTICSSRLLHPEDIIDQVYSTRRELSQALARQWFGIYIVQKSWADTWLVRGIANLMGSLFIKRHLGNNEYRLRLKKDMELCCMLDINRPPVYNQTLPYPLDPEDLDFIDLKAPIVIYMLDKRMCKGGGTLGLSRVLPKVLVSAMSGELAQNAISTHFFLRLCRKVSGFDTKVFAEQWIYKSGCPKFSFKFHFNRKKMVVEIHMSQENTNNALYSGYEHLGIDGSAVNYQELISPIFTGNLTVRIHEADGTPYEHILDIQSTQHKFEVQFNTKYKRIRRNTKRFLAKQAAAAAAVAEEEQENEEGTEGNMVLGIIPSLGLGMPIFEDATQKKDWRIIEWGQDEEDTSGAASAMFDWIRLDAEFEWLCICDFKQPDYMWAAQLTKDRDVVAQHEAIDALKHMPSLPTSTSFLRAVLDPKCFYKIRMEAAYGLASCAIPGLDWVGLHQLNKMFHKRYCFPVSSFSQSAMDDEELPMTFSIPKPNNFSSLPDYFIQKASVVAFSQVRDDRGLTPVRVRQFLLDLLKYNDNIGNEFSDCYYVATLVSSLGDALIPTRDDAVDDFEGDHVNAAAKAEIERFRTLDYVIPTYHNIITVTCLKTMTKLMLKDMLPVNIPMFMQYTRYGNYLEIRLTAFDSLFILCGLSDPTLNQYLLSVMKEDPCVLVSHYVARAMLAWLGLAMKGESDTPTNSRYIEEFAEEEGRVVIDDDRVHVKKTAQQEFHSNIENLRKRFENDVELQQDLWNLLNTPENQKLDHCIRKYLLQFCEYTFKPIDIGLKVTIRVPTVPTSSTNDESSSEPTTPTSSPIIRLNKPKHRVEEKSSKHKKSNSLSVKTESLPQDIPLSSEPTIDSPTFTEIDDVPENMTIVEPPKNRTVIEKPKKPSPLIVEPLQRVVTPTPAANGTPPPRTPTTIVVAPPKPKHKKVDSHTAEELKKCRRVINKLNKQHCALSFTQPVDEVLDGAIGYYTVIKKPMDLSMIKRKVENKEYTTFRQFEDDVRLMFSNCYAFNGPGTFVYNEGQELEAVFEKELENLRGKEHAEETQNMTIVESPATTPRITHATLPHTTTPSVVMEPPKPKVKSISMTQSEPPKSKVKSISITQSEPPKSKVKSISMTQSEPVVPERKKSITPMSEKPMKLSEREKMEQVLAKTIANPHAFEFLRPVDPIKQGIPQYTKIIKHPMDLGKIKSRFKNGQYPHAQAMDRDMRLMFSNCYTFNPPDTYVHDESKKLEEAYDREWKLYFGKEKKRKSDSSDSNNNSSSSGQHKIKIKRVEGPTDRSNSNERPTDKHMDKSSIPPPLPSTSSSPKPPPLSSSSPKPSSPSVSPSKPLPLPSSSSSKSSPLPSASSSSPKPSPLPSTSSSKPPPLPSSSTKSSTSSSSTKSSTASSSKPPKSTGPVFNAQMNDVNKVKCNRVLKKLWGLQESEPFRKPVDAVALGIPQYYEVIKRPMDLSAIQKKYDGNQYNTVWELERDIRQVFWNCYGFNDHESWVAKQCQAMEKFFNQVWSAEFAIPNALKGEDKRIASKVVNKLTLHDAAALFNEPVDVESLPDYKTIVKQPMDLRTIWEKLESGKYSSLKAVDHDIRTVFKNCFAYNLNNSYATDEGKKLEVYYNNIGKEMRARINSSPAPNSGTKKRRPSASPGPTKLSSSYSDKIPQPPSKSVKLSSSSTASAVPKDTAQKSNRKSVVKEEAPNMGIDSDRSAPVKNSITIRPPSLETPQKLHPAMVAKLESFLTKMKAHRCAFGFTEPVDPIALNIPHYPMMIKKPMDFGTMEKKLKAGEYKCVRDFESDMRLIFTNCYTFNGFDHVISLNAKVLEGILNKEGPNLRKKEEQLRTGTSSSSTSASSSPSSSKHLPGTSNIKSHSNTKVPKEISPAKAELRKYKSVLEKLTNHPSYYAFGVPVDPVLLQIPTYFDIIKKPMDFGTIRKKLDTNKYANADQLLKDAKQVFINCYLFNIPDDIVSKMGHDLQDEFNRLCSARGLRTITVDMNEVLDNEM